MQKNVSRDNEYGRLNNIPNPYEKSFVAAFFFEATFDKRIIQVVWSNQHKW